VRKRISRLPAFPLAIALTALLGAVAIAAIAAVPPNVTKAVEEQRRTTSQRPQDPAAWNDLGNLLMLAARPEEAEEAYNKAIELDPEKVSALFNLGLLHQQRGELRQAYGFYRRVVKLEPRHAWAHYQLGSLWETWRQEERAIQSYATAFAIEPQLSFPDVNPHVVENNLMTESLLRAYRSDYATPQAPAMYDNPSRIAALLVPPVPVPGQQEKDQMADQRQAPAQQQGAQSQTVLGPGDLDPNRPVGQAAPPGSVRTPGGVRGGTGMGVGPSGVAPGTVPRGLRQWDRPEPQTQPDYETGEPGNVYQQPPPPPGGVYYQPGVPSTGRLDLRLVPGRPGRDRDARG
jgi:Flp pilus assembly protein TadD